MANTVEDLMKVRYKVIAGYPEMEDDEIEVGKILTDIDSSNLLNTEYLDKFPHLFKKLEWWEDREPGEMPEYVKRSGNVFKFIELELWESYPQKIGATFHVNGIYNEITSNGTEPATKEDYESFQKTLTK